MKVYRKVLIEIEAAQLDGTQQSIMEIKALDVNCSVFINANSVKIILSNGKFARVGDWVVREGISVNVYPSDAFETAFSRQVTAPALEQFEAIVDLRTYLTEGRTDRTIDCLHYLGDDAQHWWEDRRKLYELWNLGKEAIESLKEKDKELALLNLENKVYLYAKAANVKSLQ